MPLLLYSVKNRPMDFFSSSTGLTHGCCAPYAIKQPATSANANGNRSTMAFRVQFLPAGRRTMTQIFRNAVSANTWRITALVRLRCVVKLTSQLLTTHLFHVHSFTWFLHVPSRLSKMQISLHVGSRWLFALYLQNVQVPILRRLQPTHVQWSRMLACFNLCTSILHRFFSSVSANTPRWFFRLGIGMR